MLPHKVFLHLAAGSPRELIGLVQVHRPFLASHARGVKVRPHLDTTTDYGVGLKHTAHSRT